MGARCLVSIPSLTGSQLPSSRLFQRYGCLLVSIPSLTGSQLQPTKSPRSSRSSRPVSIPSLTGSQLQLHAAITATPLERAVSIPSLTGSQLQPLFSLPLKSNSACFNPLINGESAAAVPIYDKAQNGLLSFNPLINGESAAAFANLKFGSYFMIVSIPSLTGSQLQLPLTPEQARLHAACFNPLINGESAAAGCSR